MFQAFDFDCYKFVHSSKLIEGGNLIHLEVETGATHWA